MMDARKELKEEINGLHQIIEKCTDGEEAEKYFEEGQFISQFLAHDFQRKFPVKSIGFKGEMYYYENGIYKPGAEAKIIDESKKMLGKKYTIHRANEAIGYIRADTISERNSPPPNLLNLKNGLLDLDTMTLSPHSPEHFFLAQLPVEFVAGGDCPLIKKFVKEVVRPEDVPTIQEIIGYCLYRRYEIHKAFMFIGEGSNGKSVLINVIIALLGKENVSNISLQEITSDGFSRAHLYGRMANLFADIPDKALKETGIFKMLTGGDRMYANVKFKEGFEFTNIAKMIFSCNRLPMAFDDTNAFYRRWTFVDFPNTFSEDNPKRDPKLTQKLTSQEELSGLLNWALEGLHRLLEKGYFSNSMSVDETREQYKRMSSPLLAFIDDCIHIEPGKFIVKKELYKTFCDFCKDKKLQIMADSSFSKQLVKQLGMSVSDGHKRIEGNFTRIWNGICLKTGDKYKCANRLSDTGDAGDTGISFKHCREKSYIEENRKGCISRITRITCSNDLLDDTGDTESTTTSCVPTTTSCGYENVPKNNPPEHFEAMVAKWKIMYGPGEVHIDALLGIGLTEADIQTLASCGRIHEVSPGTWKLL